MFYGRAPPQPSLRLVACCSLLADWQLIRAVVLRVAPQTNSSGCFHLVQYLGRRNRNASVIPLRQPLHFLRREKPRLVAQCKLQRIHYVIADDLGRIFIGNNRVKSFKCTHGSGTKNDRLAKMLVNHNPIKIQKTIQFNAFPSCFQALSVFT